MVCRLKVVTKEIRLVDSLCLVCRHSSCIIVRTSVYISLATLVRWYPYTTKKSEYSVIRFFRVSVEEHIRLKLNTCLYGMLSFRCGECAKLQCGYDVCL